MPTRPESLSHQGSSPASGQTVTVPLDDGRQLTYTEYGCPEGIPVIFLHGTPGSRRLGGLFETVARDCGIRLLAPDRPGSGRSSPWPDPSIYDAGQFIDLVLDDADVQTAGIIAFSGGSPYALAAAVTGDERTDRIDIVSGATPPDVSEESPVIQRLLAVLAVKAPSVLRGLFRGQAWLANRLDPSFVVGQYTSDSASSIPADAAEIVKADFVEAFTRHRRGAVTEFRNIAENWDIDFDGIDTTVHFWHGAKDTNVPLDDARRFRTRIPTARFHVLDDADHLETLLRSVPDILEEYRND